eukprot:3227795-Rhodomonas_salina.1
MRPFCQSVPTSVEPGDARCTCVPFVTVQRRASELASELAACEARTALAGRLRRPAARLRTLVPGGEPPGCRYLKDQALTLKLGDDQVTVRVSNLLRQISSNERRIPGLFFISVPPQATSTPHSSLPRFIFAATKSVIRSFFAAILRLCPGLHYPGFKQHNSELGTGSERISGGTTTTSTTKGDLPSPLLGAEAFRRRTVTRLHS